MENKHGFAVKGYLFHFIETESHFITQAGLELIMELTQGDLEFMTVLLP